MRFIAWLVGVPVAVLIVLFAVSNRDAVSIGLWPFTEGITAPSFVVALIPFALGLLIGRGWGHVGVMRARWRHRRADRKVRKMEEQMTEMRTRSTAQSTTKTQAITGPTTAAADLPPMP